MSFENFKQEDNRVASNMDARNDKILLEDIEVKRYLDMINKKGYGNTIQDVEKRVKAGVIIAKNVYRNQISNYDSMMDALSQCHNLFEAEYEDLSDQGKRVHQSVIAAILKATHKT